MHNLSFSLGSNVKKPGGNDKLTLNKLYQLITKPPQDYRWVPKKIDECKRIANTAFNELGLEDGTPEWRDFKKKNLDPVKENLPFVIPAGVCPSHHQDSDLEYNGVIQCDFDFKERDGDKKALVLKKKLESDPYVMLAALSVTGFGVKAFVLTDCKDKKHYK